MTPAKSSIKNGRIPTGIKVAYGSAELSSAIAYIVYAVYFLFFLTDVAGVSPEAAGIVLFLSHIWDGVTDPAMGIISDRTRGRFGRRRPYIFAVSVPFGLIIWLLFTAPGLDGVALTAYYTVMSMLMYLALTILTVPYTALAPEMTCPCGRAPLPSLRTATTMVPTIRS